MKRTEMNRRDFSRLTAAAFGGMVAGTVVGCGQQAPEQTPGGAGADGDGGDGGDAADGSGSTDTGGDADTGGEEVSLLMEEPHVCRGLNMCNGHGGGGDNACAGQGTCATAKAHTCAGENECKGQGGCGDKPGQNACSGQGDCAVPLGDDAWAKARAAFEEAMSAAGKDVGDAPPAG